MADPNTITRSDAQRIGWELAYRTPDPSRCLAKAAVLTRAGLLPESPYVPLLAAINEALLTLHRVPIAYFGLIVPVQREEAFRLSGAGVRLTFENLLRL